MEPVDDLGEGPRAPPNLFWVKKGEITEGRKAGRASKTTPSPTSSRSGSATKNLHTLVAPGKQGIRTSKQKS